MTTWEVDVDPIFRCLENQYKGSDAPKLNIAFFDIETSYDKDNGGWSEAGDANNYITSISVYLQWIDEIICLSVPPDTLTWDEAQKIADEVGNTILFEKESDMLSAFIDTIEDADILSGWNSEMYDVPYIINRIIKVMGKSEIRRLCLWEQMPKARKFNRGGKDFQSYDLIGRVHIDYMQIYKKYTQEQKHSYALNAIAEIELGDSKVEYDGTLDELYHDDYKKFLQYNIQDTKLLDKLDKKLQYIDLANAIAHDSCVLIQTTMGAVATTDQSILVEAHERGLVCMNKKKYTNHDDSDEEANDEKAAGGWVATPRKGFHRWLASTDMKSLYPSTIRALNMSPETIVGQLRLDRTYKELDDSIKNGTSKDTFGSWWNDRFNVLEMDNFYNQDIQEIMILDMEDGTSFEVTGKELYELIFESGQPWCISANGTIFRTDKDGVIPGLLTKWYAGRKATQKIAAGINQINNGLELSDDLLELFE